MEKLGNGDGGNWPPDGPGLPGLPSSWGAVVVPDDPAELADESARIRAELRHERRRRRWWRRARWAVRPDEAGRPTVRLPALVLAIAILATLTSLFTLGYASVQRGGQAGSEGSPSVSASRPQTLPALDLLDATGRAVSLRAQLPAVILLIEGCSCDELVAATAAAAPVGVAVLVVARSIPAPPTTVAGLENVRPLADPAGELRSLLALPASAPRAGALLVEKTAEIVRALAHADSVGAFQADLASLVTT